MKYLDQIPNLEFSPITEELFEVIQLEGLNEEFDLFLKTDWSYSILKISDEDSELLKKLDKQIVNEFNAFDIKLKELHSNLIDFIDYDSGTVKIIKAKK